MEPKATPALLRRALSRVPAPDLLGAALVGLVPMVRVLASGQDFFGSGTDVVTMEYPLAAFAADWLHKGVLPLWNPYIAGGVPFPTATTGTFSPAFLLGLVMPCATAIKVRIALSLAVAGAGGAWLCRPLVRSRLASFLGGALFATSGFLAAHLFAGHLELVAASAFVPWMVGIVDRVRRRTRIAWGPSAACFALALLAAHYQMVALGCLGAALFAGTSALLEAPDVPVRSRMRDAAIALGALGALLVLGAAVAAVQILPLAEILRFTQRQAPGPEFTSSFPATPASFVAMLLPGLLDRSADLHFVGEFAPWEAFGYVGLVALALGAYAMTTLPRARWGAAATCAGLAALLSLGDRTPLLRVLVALVPPFGRFRASGRFLVIFSLFGALLAALGLDAFMASAESASRRRQLAGPVALTGAVLGLAIALTELPTSALARAVTALAPVDMGATGTKWAATLDRLQGDAFVSVLVLGATVVALALGAEPIRRAGAARALALLAVLDTMRVGIPFLSTAPHSAFEWVAPLVEHCREALGPGGRWMPTPELGSPNLGAPYDLASPTGYSIFLDDRYARYMNRAAGRPLDAFATVVQPDGASPLLRHLGIDLVLTGAPLAGPDRRAHLGMGDYHLIGGMPRVQVLAADTPIPRVALVHAVVEARDELDAYARMEEASFDLRSTALVEAPAGTFDVKTPPPSAHEETRITTYEPNVVGVHVDAAAPGLVVLSDVYEEGWTALVDGARGVVVPVNRIMRGVPVGAGSHEVVMRYRPPGLTTGAWLSGAGLLAVVAMTIGAWRRRRTG